MLIYVTRLNISFLATDGQSSQVKLIFHLNSLEILINTNKCF